MWEPQGDNLDLVNWDSSPNGWFKCNVDVDFNHHLRTTYRGWCIRNNQGNFVTASTAWDEGLLPVLETKALDLKEVIQEVIWLHHVPVTFDSDS